MRRVAISAFIFLVTASYTIAQRTAPASVAELAAITERGRQLAEYDVAAWHASDAVMAMQPPEGSVERYLAKKVDGKWLVGFGKFNEKSDRFLIAYEASQGASATEFTVKRYDPPKEDAGFYLSAARAGATALADFKGEKRPYNVAILPAASGQMYVYVLPAQTVTGVYPHGGDVRYLISSDSSKIVERRQLHKTILEFTIDGKIEAGFHTAVMDEIPEDTDVFYVLTRKPSVPEWIGTQKYVYLVEPDGKIRYLMTMDAFRKIGK